MMFRLSSFFKMIAVMQNIREECETFPEPLLPEMFFYSASERRKTEEDKYV